MSIMSRKVPFLLGCFVVALLELCSQIRAQSAPAEFSEELPFPIIHSGMCENERVPPSHIRDLIPGTEIGCNAIRWWVICPAFCPLTPTLAFQTCEPTVPRSLFPLTLSAGSLSMAVFLCLWQVKGSGVGVCGGDMRA
eukprot:3623655-Rhodomonas_salina.2